MELYLNILGIYTSIINGMLKDIAYILTLYIYEAEKGKFPNKLRTIDQI